MSHYNKEMSREEKVKLFNRLYKKYCKDKGTWGKVGEEIGVAPQTARALYMYYTNATINKKDKAKVKVTSFIDDLLGSLPKVIKKITPLDIACAVGNNKGDEEEMVLVLSDWQIGHKTNTFNMKIARKRIKNLLKGVLRITALYRRSIPIKKIHVMILGDIVHNDRVGLTIDQAELEDIVINQTYKCAIPLLNFVVDTLSQNFEKVHLHCVYGNHGHGEKLSSKKNNWDNVIYKTLELQYKGSNKITVRVAESFYMLVKIFNTTFLLAHGNQVSSSDHITSLHKTMLKWETSIRPKWNVLIVGHWHTYSNTDQNYKELIVNGTIVSDDDHVRERYGWNAKPEQTLLMVHSRHGITSLRKMHL